MTNAITNAGYYCAQSTYVKSSYYYSNRTLGEGDFQSAVLEKDEDNSELANTAAKENETAKIWGDTGCFWTLGSAQLRYQSVSFEGKIDTKSDESKEETAKEIVTPLRCLGTIPVGMNHSYIMTASEVIKEGSDEKIIRVHLGGKDVDVDVSEVDQKNATVIEMFAYCQYADANGTGTHDTFGSFHSMKLVTDPFGENSYSSIEEAMTKKQNWTDTISNSKTVATKYATNETIDASDLLKMLEETYNILLAQKSDKDMKDLTDEEWDEIYQKLL